MGCLVDQHPTSFQIPFAPPRVGTVIGFIAPTQHHHSAQNRPVNLSICYRLLHPSNGLVEAALAHHTQLHAGLIRRRDRPIAIPQRGCQRLLDEHMDLCPGGGDCQLCVGRMGCTDSDHLHIRRVQHLFYVLIGPNAKAIGKALGLSAARNCDETRLWQVLKDLSVSDSHFATTNQCGTDSIHFVSPDLTSLTSANNSIDLSPRLPQQNASRSMEVSEDFRPFYTFPWSKCSISPESADPLA